MARHFTLGQTGGNTRQLELSPHPPSAPTEILLDCGAPRVCHHRAWPGCNRSLDLSIEIRIVMTTFTVGRSSQVVVILATVGDVVPA